MSNLGNYNATRETYVRESTFHHGLGVAIGISSSNNIPVESNVVYHTIDCAIKIEGSGNLITNNLVATNYWGATFQPEEATLDKTYVGAIDISKADSAVVTDNFVAGAERVGIAMRGDLCPGGSLPGSLAHSVRRNTVYGAGTGVSVQPKQAYSLGCMEMSEFTVYKSQYFGIYYQASGAFTADSNTLVDNQINVFSIIFSPSASSHIATDKKVNIKNSLIVGKSSLYDCAEIKPNNLSDANSLFNTFGAGQSGSGVIGLTWPTFIGGPNGFPDKPASNIISYNQVGGEMVVTNVTFANFQPTACGNEDFALSSSKNNDDGQHPLSVNSLNLFNVHNGSKVCPA